MKLKPKYTPKDFEGVWSKKWLNNKLYKRNNIKKGDKKFYSLYSFPYPSGSGLHVGHVEGMVANDIAARFYRMCGYNSFLPMGWDSFGLPAENYAISTKKHPKDTTTEAIAEFINQINTIGIGVDWDSEVGAHTPEYYKWTQWIFLQMFKRGVAYKANAPVNWCESCQTVLANEQVVEGKCERCGTVVNQRQMNQWFYKITDYADRLINDLQKLDWPNSTKAQQLNWIGKSEGAEIKFKINNEELKIKEIGIFTTRPDTIFGATFLVLAPEHSFVSEVLAKCHSELSAESIIKAKEIEEYVLKSKNKTDLQRQVNKEKTGVDLGIKAINPVNGSEIPIYIADYVLMGYGTGAIMAVPAHDDRDFEFAKKFNLEVIQVIESNEELPFIAEGKLINSDYLNGLESVKDKAKIIETLAQKIGATKKTTYRLRDWLLSRQRYWGAPIPIVYDPQGTAHDVKQEHLPWLLPTDVDFIPKGYSPLSRSKELLERTERLYGKGWTPEVDTMDTFVDSSWYFLRHLDAKNDTEFVNREIADSWLPTDLYMIGTEHIVLHLFYARFFTKFLFDNNYIGFDEPFYKMRHMGTVLGPDGKKMSKRWGNVINPNDVVKSYGADTLRVYQMFMAPLELEKPWNDSAIAGVYRFLNKVWDLMHNNFAKQSDRQLVSKLNYTIKKVGDDIKELKFNTAIACMMEFANSWQALELKINNDKLILNNSEHGEQRPGSKVGTDKQDLGGEILSKTDLSSGVITELDAYKFLQILAPFAPFITEELNSKVFNNTTSIHLSTWPMYDENLIITDQIVIPVQVNGKVRGELMIKNEELKIKITVLTKARELVKNYIGDKQIKKEIYVPGKIVNFVV